MLGKVGSKYKIDRRRTRQKVKLHVAEIEGSESVSPVKECDIVKGEDEVQGEEKVRRERKGRKRRACSLDYKLKGDETFSTGDTSDDDSGHQVVESVALFTRNTRRVRNKIMRARRSNSSRRIDRLSTHHPNRGCSENGGDILATLPSPQIRSKRSSATNAKEKLMKMAKDEIKYDADSDDDNYENEKDRLRTGIGDGDEEDSDYDDERENEVDDLPIARSNKNEARNSKKSKRKKVVNSSEEEFLLDSDVDDDSSLDCSSNDDVAIAELAEDDNEMLMIGDPDLSDEDGENEKGSDGIDTVNIDNQNFGTIDDVDDDLLKGRRQKKRVTIAGKNEILPSPRGIEDAFEGDSDRQSNDDVDAKFMTTTSLWRQTKCPKCPSTEDAITAEPLPRRHICYVAPDGKSRQCFNLETLRQIALNSSRLELRVDIDGERQNFLQPPAFRTAMSDDLVDQIASKFGRGALDLHGAYYKNRDMRYDNKGVESDYDSNSSSSDENIYDSFAAFRERVKDYFKNGMGSQDVYVCPLCYGQIHRSIQNPDESDSDASKEYESIPCDSIYDPMMVLGHLDKDDMSMASQFCFKKLADVKKHLREEHHVDTRRIQGNDLYKRFRVRAPDGLLQRWLSTQVKGHVKQGHMRMYWGQGNDQIFIQLLDFIERVKVYSEELRQFGYESSEDDGVDSELNDNAIKARAFYNSFAKGASRLWKNLSSPFLKGNENIDDFIEKDTDSIDENDQEERPHANLHRQLMNSMNEDSDENDLVHKLQRKYAETTNNEDGDCRSSSTEDELEFVDNHKESDGEDDEQEIYNRNGYYSPIEEEKDEWILNLQSQRKRKVSKPKKRVSSENKIRTPVGKRLFRRKSTPTGTAKSTSGATKGKRTLSIEDSSDDDSF